MGEANVTTMKTFGCRAALVACAALALVSCGGSAPGAAPAVPGGVTSLAMLEMTSSSPTVLAKSGETATITITAIDANRNALPDIPISLSADSGVLTGTGTKTDAQGKMTVTFGLGADRGNRDVTITATSGAVTGIASLRVEGNDGVADRIAADCARCNDACRDHRDRRRCGQRAAVGRDG
jgi:hypothetical protein